MAIVVLTIAIFGFPLFKLLGGFDGTYVDISFWPLAALVLVIPLKSIRLGAIDRYFKVVFWLALMSDLIQIALFVLFGRLPALAFKESLSVRFGGVPRRPKWIWRDLVFIDGVELLSIQWQKAHLYATCACHFASDDPVSDLYRILRTPHLRNDLPPDRQEAPVDLLDSNSKRGHLRTLRDFTCLRDHQLGPRKQIRKRS